MHQADRIKNVDPKSAEYTRDYRSGWDAGERGAEGALDRADGRGVSHAWYDGYMDAATGRPKWTFRGWRVNGCDSTCGYTCDGPHRAYVDPANGRQSEWKGQS